ncbi:MAG: SIR2 family protein [Bacteriovoracales bacterium]|nr:SIR2 family protein [Bacteriovoracales bacterium]
MQRKTLLFVGAGFSKGLCDQMPLLEDLSKEIAHSEEYLRWGRSYNDNLESLLSFLSAQLPWESSERKYEKHKSLSLLIEKIKRAILKGSSHYQDSLNDVDSGNEYVDLLRKKWHDERGLVISLNYDTLVESLYLKFVSSNIDLEQIYKINIAPITTAMPPVANDPPTLLKLHGSINWYHLPFQKNSQLYYGCPRLRDEKFRSERFKNLDSYETMIVPPTFMKQNLINHEQILKVWRDIKSYLDTYSKLAIVGYSFQDSDLMLRQLFSSLIFPYFENLKSKNSISIYFINPDDDARERFDRFCKQFKILSKSYKKIEETDLLE